MRRTCAHYWPALVLTLAATGCARHFGLASARLEAQPWASALVGSWALVDSPSTSGESASTLPRDTAVWHIDRGGRLRHAVAARGEREREKERTTELAWWWVESQSVAGAQVPLLCTSVRPSRNRQCACIHLDTLSRADGRVTKRFSWSGVTFKSQHWTFIERNEGGAAAPK